MWAGVRARTLGAFALIANLPSARGLQVTIDTATDMLVVAAHYHAEHLQQYCLDLLALNLSAVLEARYGQRDQQTGLREGWHGGRHTHVPHRVAPARVRGCVGRGAPQHA